MVLTKGFERYKIVLTKVIVMTMIWTIWYLICFGITYVYSWYFWDNSIVNNLLFSVLIWWIFGIFVITLYTLLTINFENNGGALAIIGIIVFGMYLLGLLPKINQYLPTLLTNGNSLIKGLEEVGYYIPSLIITLCLSILFVIGSILIFNKKKL